MLKQTACFPFGTEDTTFSQILSVSSSFVAGWTSRINLWLFSLNY